MPFHVKRLVAGMILIATALVPAARAGELSPPELYDHVVASTLALKVTSQTGEKYVGAAFLAVQPDCAVTAWHLIRDAEVIQGTFSDGQPAVVGEVIARDEFHDLALLRIQAPGRRLLPLNLQTPRIASRLYAFGSPRGYAFSISDGLLSQVQTIDGFPQYQLTCPFSPGNSGGPVVNALGEVVGVSAWTKLGAQNLNFAIPSRFIQDLVMSVSTEEPAGSPESHSAQVSAKDAGPEPVKPASDQAIRGSDDVAGTEKPGTLAQLQSLLKSLAGQQVRITVSSAGQSRDFVCDLPAEPTAPANLAQVGTETTNH